MFLPFVFQYRKKRHGTAAGAPFFGAVSILVGSDFDTLILDLYAIIIVRMFLKSMLSQVPPLFLNSLEAFVVIFTIPKSNQ